MQAAVLRLHILEGLSIRQGGRSHGGAANHSRTGWSARHWPGLKGGRLAEARP